MWRMVPIRGRDDGTGRVAHANAGELGHENVLAPFDSKLHALPGGNAFDPDPTQPLRPGRLPERPDRGHDRPRGWHRPGVGPVTATAQTMARTMARAMETS